MREEGPWCDGRRKSGAVLAMVRASRGAVKAAPLAAALVVALLLAGCGDLASSPAAGTFTPRTPGVLTVVTTDIPSPGFWEGTPAHVTGGLEYELARDLADYQRPYRCRLTHPPLSTAAETALVQLRKTAGCAAGVAPCTSGLSGPKTAGLLAAA